MKFSQKFYIGFTHLSRYTNVGVHKHVSDKVYIRAGQVEAAAGYAGSCHVLEMGRHYAEYVRYKEQFPSFPRAPGFPHSPYLNQLDIKSRASNVTGNIGEIIAGVVARRTLKIDAAGIALLKTSPNSQTPDYLLQRTPEFTSVLAEIAPALAGVTLPEWWPMESKARSDGGVACVQGALKQLAAYWYHNRYSDPDSVGYGIVVAACFKRPRSVSVHLFAPEDQAALITHLQGFGTYKDYRKKLDDDAAAARLNLKTNV